MMIINKGLNIIGDFETLIKHLVTNSLVPYITIYSPHTDQLQIEKQLTNIVEESFENNHLDDSIAPFLNSNKNPKEENK